MDPQTEESDDTSSRILHLRKDSAGRYRQGRGHIHKVMPRASQCQPLKTACGKLQGESHLPLLGKILPRVLNAKA